MSGRPYNLSLLALKAVLVYMRSRTTSMTLGEFGPPRL